jgi:hypothetical protein
VEVVEVELTVLDGTLAAEAEAVAVTAQTFLGKHLVETLQQKQHLH